MSSTGLKTVLQAQGTWEIHDPTTAPVRETMLLIDSNTGQIKERTVHSRLRMKEPPGGSCESCGDPNSELCRSDILTTYFVCGRDVLEVCPTCLDWLPVLARYKQVGSISSPAYSVGDAVTLPDDYFGIVSEVTFWGAPDGCLLWPIYKVDRVHWAHGDNFEGVEIYLEEREIIEAEEPAVEQDPKAHRMRDPKAARRPMELPGSAVPQIDNVLPKLGAPTPIRQIGTRGD